MNALVLNLWRRTRIFVTCLKSYIILLDAGVKNVSGMKAELTMRLEQIKDLVPDKVLPLPAHTYFEEPGKITNNEHKAIMQVNNVDSMVVFVCLAFALISWNSQELSVSMYDTYRFTTSSCVQCGVG